MRWWLKEYLLVFLERAPTEAETTSWLYSVKEMIPLSHFFWASWCMVQVEESPIDFDYVQYAKLRFGEAKKILRQKNTTKRILCEALSLNFADPNIVFDKQIKFEEVQLL